MRSSIKRVLILVNFLFLWAFLSIGCLAKTKENSIINLFCIENFKEEMLKANIKYEKDIAEETCDCYLKEFTNTKSHQKAIKECKLQAKTKFNLK